MSDLKKDGEHRSSAEQNKGVSPESPRPETPASEEKKSMRRRDIILIAVIVSAVALVFGVYMLVSHLMEQDVGDGSYVTVEVDGTEIARYDLTEDGEYSLNGGTNILRIENGQAYIIEANCPDQICVHTGAAAPLQPIVCLPNRLTVTYHRGDQ